MVDAPHPLPPLCAWLTPLTPSHHLKHGCRSPSSPFPCPSHPPGGPITLNMNDTLHPLITLNMNDAPHPSHHLEQGCHPSHPSHYLEHVWLLYINTSIELELDSCNVLLNYTFILHQSLPLYYQLLWRSSLHKKVVLDKL